LSFLLEKLAPNLPVIAHLFSYLILGFFTGLQPPILRSFFCFLTGLLEGKFHLHWSPLFQTLMGSFICLCLFPHWITSLSFLLSLGATLSVSAGCYLSKSKLESGLHSKTSVYDKLISGALTYLCLIPLLWGWGQAHPLGILTNIFLAPALSLTLWILSGLWLIWPSAAILGFDILLRILSEMANWMPLTVLPGQTTLPSKWIYVLLLILFLWILQLRKYRKTACQNETL
jgi:competence protein ComEC